MAYFAELDQINTVIQVIAVSNKDTSDEHGVEKEEIGIAFCKSLFGENTRWLQTSYNNKIRVRYAGIGYTYDESRDAFIKPKPYPSWLLNETTIDWESPVGPCPPLTPEEIGVYTYVWDENTISWQKIPYDIPR